MCYTRKIVGFGGHMGLDPILRSATSCMTWAVTCKPHFPPMQNEDNDIYFSELS